MDIHGTKGKKAKKRGLFQIADSGLLALEGALGGNTLPSDIPQHPESREARLFCSTIVRRSKLKRKTLLMSLLCLTVYF